MEYSVKLYGKVGLGFIPLEKNTDDIEKLERKVALLQRMYYVGLKALRDIKDWNDDLEDEWDNPGSRAEYALLQMEKFY